jgi:hypothetical protein
MTRQKSEAYKCRSISAKNTEIIDGNGHENPTDLN